LSALPVPPTAVRDPDVTDGCCSGRHTTIRDTSVTDGRPEGVTPAVDAHQS
jgi:hypothetical protein